jgi:hypothetical protein
MARHRAADWDAIRAAYRKGSIRMEDVGAQFGISRGAVWKILHGYDARRRRFTGRQPDRPTLCPCGSKLTFRVMPMTGTVVEECRAGCRGSRKLVAA